MLEESCKNNLTKNKLVNNLIDKKKNTLIVNILLS